MAPVEGTVIKWFEGPAGKIEQHTYASGGRRYYVHMAGSKFTAKGPTTVLNAISKPALQKWYAQQQEQYTAEAAWELFNELGECSSKNEFTEQLKTRMDGHIAADKIKDEAADIGTAIHDACETQTRYWLAQARGEFGFPPVDVAALADDVAMGYRAWLDWVTVNDVKFIDAECAVYSRQLNICGQVDAVAIVNEHLTIVDYKTGKSIYGEAGLQVAAYAQAYNEWYNRQPTQAVIVKLPKTVDIEFETRTYTGPELLDNLHVFKAAQVISAWQDRDRQEYFDRKKRGE